MENIEEIFYNYATEYFRTETDSNYTMAINLDDFKKLIEENFSKQVDCRVSNDFCEHCGIRFKVGEYKITQHSIDKYGLIYKGKGIHISCCTKLKDKIVDEYESKNAY